MKTYDYIFLIDFLQYFLVLHMMQSEYKKFWCLSAENSLYHVCQLYLHLYVDKMPTWIQIYTQKKVLEIIFYYVYISSCSKYGMHFTTICQTSLAYLSQF